jgi:hypothetical protein
MEPKYYPLLNFVGHCATMQTDARRLLEQIGAWDDYGRSGWGKSSKHSIFQKTPIVTKSMFQKYYSTPEIEKKAQKYFKADYDNPLLNVTRRVRFEEGSALLGSAEQKLFTETSAN